MHAQRRLSVALICVFLNVYACRKPSSSEFQNSDEVKLEPRLPQGPPTVTFDLKVLLVKNPAKSLSYHCTYRAGGKTAKFRLEWTQSGPLSGEIPMASADGKFIAVDGSENAVLLADLSKALEAKKIPTDTARISELTFDAVVLGDRQSRDDAGGFHESPPGDWVLLKLFLPKGGDDGEVFLNLNPVLGKGEFSIKDSDYGDYLLARLSKVL